MTGGAGNDIFQLTTPGGIDKITDFNPNNDIIHLENSIFTSLGVEGILDSSKLRAGSGVIKAADSNDYLLYNSTNGYLYYDSDAMGSASSPLQIALLSPNLAVNNSDFVIV